MTKLLCSILVGLVIAITAPLPRWKKLTVRARIFDRLQPFAQIDMMGRQVEIFVPDRTSVYWAKYGPNSEPMTNAWIDSFDKNDAFLDVGANIGFFSLMAATKDVSRIYALEPNPFSYAALCKNIERNNLGQQIVPLNFALSQTSELIDFGLSGTHAGSIDNQITSPTGEHTLALKMPALSLDDLSKIGMIAGTRHIKIDIDGLELQVIKGAKKMLSSGEILTVMIEDSGDTAEIAAVLNAMTSYGFETSDAFGRQINYTLFVRA